MAAETLWYLRGRVAEIKPNASSEGINGWLNRRIRNVIDTRTWADLLKIGVINVPAQYTTGTVTLTAGSRLVAGVGTSWPTNDAVNTIADEPIRKSPGYVEIKPASMTGIEQGQFLLIDVEHA